MRPESTGSAAGLSCPGRPVPVSLRQPPFAAVGVREGAGVQALASSAPSTQCLARAHDAGRRRRWQPGSAGERIGSGCHEKHTHVYILVTRSPTRTLQLPVAVLFCALKSGQMPMISRPQMQSLHMHETVFTLAYIDINARPMSLTRLQCTRPFSPRPTQQVRQA